MDGGHDRAMVNGRRPSRGLRVHPEADALEAPTTSCCAHSLGSLICYDTFLRNRGCDRRQGLCHLRLADRQPVSPRCFAGRIEPLKPAYGTTSSTPTTACSPPLEIAADNFEQILEQFDMPNDVLNHDPIWYLPMRTPSQRVARPRRAPGRAP